MLLGNLTMLKYGIAYFFIYNFSYKILKINVLT
jgi:hypothetical protein